MTTGAKTRRDLRATGAVAKFAMHHCAVQCNATKYGGDDTTFTRSKQSHISCHTHPKIATTVITHQLQIERRTGKVFRPETDVLYTTVPRNQL